MHEELLELHRMLSLTNGSASFLTCDVRITPMLPAWLVLLNVLISILSKSQSMQVKINSLLSWRQTLRKKKNNGTYLLLGGKEIGLEFRLLRQVLKPASGSSSPLKIASTHSGRSQNVVEIHPGGQRKSLKFTDLWGMVSQTGIMAHTFILALWRQKQMELCKLETRLVYIRVPDPSGLHSETLSLCLTYQLKYQMELGGEGTVL